jgi:hypothetical protein
MFGLSRVKLPMTFRMRTLNKPLTPEELSQARIDPHELTPVTNEVRSLPPAKGCRYDDLADLAAQDTVVVVCLSGGGSRAARMAAFAMEELERKYNEVWVQNAIHQPLARRIDAWSTVSGGSVYGSYVATYLGTLESDHRVFWRIAEGRRARYATQKLGAMAAVFYFWPPNVAVGPILQLLTEWDTYNLFARTHGMFQEGAWPGVSVSNLRKLGDLPPKPRFYFNATSLETARPMIFTQSVLHRDLHGDPLTRMVRDPLVAWTLHAEDAPGDHQEPLRYATTLEDLGSSTARFPVAHSVLASAAFPGAFAPLVLHKFDRPTNGVVVNRDALEKLIRQPMEKILPVPIPLWRQERIIKVVDGGVYDNTGLVTALELYSYLLARQTNSAKAPRLVLLSVDANSDSDVYEGIPTDSKLPFRFDFPLRGVMPALSTFSHIYAKKKVLVRAAIEWRLRQLKDKDLVKHYEINLLGATKAFPEVKQIPTDFVISDKEDNLLRRAVDFLVNKNEQGGDTLAEAFVRGLGPPRIDAAWR